MAQKHISTTEKRSNQGAAIGVASGVATGAHKAQKAKTAKMTAKYHYAAGNHHLNKHVGHEMQSEKYEKLGGERAPGYATGEVQASRVHKAKWIRHHKAGEEATRNAGKLMKAAKRAPLKHGVIGAGIGAGVGSAELAYRRSKHKGIDNK